MNEFIRKFKLHKELTLLHAKKDANDISCLRFDNIMCLVISVLIGSLAITGLICLITLNGIVFAIISTILIVVAIIILISLCYCESAYKVVYREVSKEYEETQKKLIALDVNANETWDSKWELSLTKNDIEFISKMMIEFNKLNKA